MLNASSLEGTYTALITPFTADGQIDFQAFSSLVERQIADGIDGLVPCGTTGESATMDAAEQASVIAICVDEGCCYCVWWATLDTGMEHAVALGRAAVLVGPQEPFCWSAGCNVAMDTTIAAHSSLYSCVSSEALALVRNIV